MSRIVFDIGASTLRVAHVTADGIGDVSRVRTPHDPARALRVFQALVEDKAVEEATGGIPAIVSSEGNVVTSTNLPKWNGFPFRQALSRILHAPVQVRNDAELAGLGEAVYGAGKGYRTVAYLGVGTGVGTSLIIEGSIDAHSSEGSVRDSIIALPGGSTLETRIGGHALFSRYGMHPQELPRAVWTKLTLLLAEGIGNAVSVWAPDIIVLGGSLMNETNGFRLEDIERALEVVAPEAAATPVKVAALKDESGLYGAKAWQEREKAA